jgi:hypothetical protein
MSNPFASPPDTPRTPGFVPQVPGYNPSAGFVAQVRVVAILMMILGTIETLIGLFVIGGMIVVAVNVPPGEFNGSEAVVLGVVYGSFAAVFVFVGLARIFAGYLNYNFRGRVIGIISHFAGFVLLLSCYCGITAIAMGVYGLIVFFQPVVAEAFAMRRRGSTANDVLIHFRKQGTYPYAPGQQTGHQNYMQPSEPAYSQPEQPVAPSQPVSRDQPATEEQTATGEQSVAPDQNLGKPPESPPGPEAEGSPDIPPTDSDSSPENPN